MPDLNLELTLTQQFELTKIREKLNSASSKDLEELKQMVVSLMEQNYRLKNAFASIARN